MLAASSGGPSSSAPGRASMSFWSDASPEDLFIYIFSFLFPSELVQSARVSRSWHSVAYTSCLWSSLDLSRVSHLVTSSFLKRLFSSPRFESLQWLSLEGCVGIAPSSLRQIALRCRKLRTLLLTQCSTFPPRSVLPFQGGPLPIGVGPGQAGDGVLDPLPPAPVPLRIDDTGLRHDRAWSRIDKLIEVHQHRLAVQLALEHDLELPSDPALMSVNAATDDSSEYSLDLGGSAAAGSSLLLTEHDTIKRAQIAEQMKWDMEREDDEDFGETEAENDSPAHRDIMFDDIVQLVDRLPELRTLELQGCLFESAAVPALLARFPQLNLGFFYFQYCAEAGVNPLSRQPETCRYESNTNIDRNCFGRVSGRLMHSSCFYPRRGNYPTAIIYTCEGHRLEPMHDAALQMFTCIVCERQLDRASMDSIENVSRCRLCADRQRLVARINWTSLNKESGSAPLHALANTTIRASSQNIPGTLRLYDLIPCAASQSSSNNANFSIAEPENLDNNPDVANDDNPNPDDGDAAAEGPPDWMVRIFGVPGSRTDEVDQRVKSIQLALKRAYQNGETRALICYSEQPEQPPLSYLLAASALPDVSGHHQFAEMSRPHFDPSVLQSIQQSPNFSYPKFLLDALDTSLNPSASQRVPASIVQSASSPVNSVANSSSFVVRPTYTEAAAALVASDPLLPFFASHLNPIVCTSRQAIRAAIQSQTVLKLPSASSSSRFSGRSGSRWSSSLTVSQKPTRQPLWIKPQSFLARFFTQSSEHEQQLPCALHEGTAFRDEQYDNECDKKGDSAQISLGATDGEVEYSAFDDSVIDVAEDIEASQLLLENDLLSARRSSAAAPPPQNSLQPFAFTSSLYVNPATDASNALSRGPVVAVYADKGPIPLGEQGSAHLQLTHLAWRHSMSILWSLLGLLSCLAAYSLLLDSPFTALSYRVMTTQQWVPPSIILPSGDGSASFFGTLGTGLGALSTAVTSSLGADAAVSSIDTRRYSYYQWTDLSSPESNSDLQETIITSASLGVVVALMTAFACRNRARWEMIFRGFLIVDLFLLFAVGGGSLVLSIGALFNIPLDWFTYLVLMFNFGVGGTFALYGPSESSNSERGASSGSETVLQYFLLLLYAIMAVMMSSVLNPYITMMFLAIMALADVVAEARPHWGAFGGFILPAELEFIYSTPRVMMTFGRIKLRSSELLWFAILIASMPSWFGGALYPAILCSLCGISFITFYAPYAGIRLRRPIPTALMMMIPVLLVSVLSGMSFSASLCKAAFE